MSKTGDALEALFNALVLKSQEPQPEIPTPEQNEDLAARLKEMSDTAVGLAMGLNVWDDSGDEPDEVLGAAGEAEYDVFEIVREVPVEFVVAGGTREQRRAAFEAGLEAIYAAIAADSTLGGTVDEARMLAPRRNGSGTVADGMPNLLAAEIRIRLTFTSNRPF